LSDLFPVGQRPKLFILHLHSHSDLDLEGRVRDALDRMEVEGRMMV
jgi:hypothetical protein